MWDIAMLVWPGAARRVTQEPWINDTARADPPMPCGCHAKVNSRGTCTWLPKNFIERRTAAKSVEDGCHRTYVDCRGGYEWKQKSQQLTIAC
jgi:hypothetical protein